MEEQQTTPAQPSVTPKEFPWKRLSIALIVFILVVGGMGTVFAWRTPYLDPYLPASVKEFFGRGEERGEPTPEEVEEQIKDWKTYKNETYGYEIKYPSTWFYAGSKGAPAESAAQVVFDANQEDLTNPALEAHAIVITVAEREIPDPLLDCELYGEEQECERKSITIGGVQGEQVDFLESNFLQSAVAQGETASRSSRVYYFNLQKKDEHREIYDLMLFTFEFLPEEEPTKGWETYRNEKYGYEIKYPPTWLYGGSKGAPAASAAQVVFDAKKEDLSAPAMEAHAIVITVAELARGSTQIPPSLLECEPVYDEEVECERKAITIGGMQGVQIDYLVGGGLHLHSYVFQSEAASHPPRVWSFALQKKAEYREVYDLMLPTFKFL